MSESLGAASTAGIGVRDVPLALFAPRRFFTRVQDVPAYGWSLVLLLLLVTLIGGAIVETGLIDRQVERHVAERIAIIDKEQRDIVDRATMRELYDNVHKAGEFEKMLARMQVIVAAPITVLASILGAAALLYGLVAITGRKPEWHTLMTVCVFAAYVDLAALLFRLLLMIRFQNLEVNTSLALLIHFFRDSGNMPPTTLAALYGPLSALDPFRLWYWMVVIAGLTVTVQLPGWRAWLTCGLLWIAAAGVRSGLAIASVSQSGAPPQVKGTQG